MLEARAEQLRKMSDSQFKPVKLYVQEGHRFSAIACALVMQNRMLRAETVIVDIDRVDARRLPDAIRRIPAIVDARKG